MKLSIIIVNYNVQYFLEQCLFSVSKALKGISSEVFVVDNNSVDGSVSMVKSKFPDTILIENKKNTGFSFANNQAIRLAKGEYVLLLNPDTLVEEDTFLKVIGFMDENQDGGGLGVYMIDGAGNYLPESKRGLPTPAVAFYKIFGLSRLFPKSKTFGKYHLGYLDKNQTNEVEVLSGAFMLLRKKALEKVGLLDENFFMYGEDIDLSYRIIKGGFKNYYYPQTKIIHYKGESTKKSSINYVFVFYNAMIIFARKHFTQSNVRLFAFLINFAIYLRAGTAILYRYLKMAALPLMDSTLILGGLIFLKNYWENVVKMGTGIKYSLDMVMVAFPLYILIWLVAVFYSGGYDKPVKYFKVVKGLAIGTGVILIFYSLISEEYRFSRAMILFGAIWSVIATFSIRFVFHLLKIKGYEIASERQKRVIVVGGKEEFERISLMLTQSEISLSFVANIVVNENQLYAEAIGTINQLQEAVEIYTIDEIIFAAKDIPSHTIIACMAVLDKSKTEFKIAPPESLYIIGSNSIETNGELYVINIDSISKAVNQRNKRVFDVLSSSFLLVTSPFLFVFLKNPFNCFRNTLMVFVGKMSWVGYSDEVKQVHDGGLPCIKKGILNPLDALKLKQIDNNNIRKINHLYAKDYNVYGDLNILIKGYKRIGRR